MVYPKNRALHPPIQRSWLRLRLGKAYYAARRYALWCSPRYRWARERRQDSLPGLPARPGAPLPADGQQTSAVAAGARLFRRAQGWVRF